MADNAIALGVQVPDAMKSISGMMGLAIQAQGLQNAKQQLLNSQQQYQVTNTELQKNQMMLGERQGIQKLFSDPSQFNDKDGNPDYNKLITEGMKVAPTTFPSMVPQIIQAHKSGVEATKALNDLGNENRARVGQIIMSLGSMPATDAMKYLQGMGEQNPILKPIIAHANQYLLGPAAASGDPAAWKKATTIAGMATIGPSAQATAMTPNYLGTGGANEQTSPVAAALGAPQTIKNTVPPSGRQEIGKDLLGNAVVTAKDPQGNASIQSLPGATKTPMVGFPTGENEASKGELLQHRADAQAQAANVPSEHQLNEKIISLAPEAFTGSAADFRKYVGNLPGMQWTGAGPASTELQHYMAVQIQNNAKAQGLNTDAARKAGEQSILPTDSPEKATKNIIKFNDALATGKELYNKGLTAAINHPQNEKDIFAVRDFRNAWAQNFEPKVLQLENAAKAKDKEEIDRILGPEGSALRKNNIEALRAKKNIMQQLIDTGRIKNGP